MEQQLQTFNAPDGTEMVVLSKADYNRLLDAAEDTIDALEAKKILAEMEIEGGMPAEVLDFILDNNLHPIAAWRKYRGMSQAELARKAGLSQVWVSRIENGGGHGTPKTRKKIAGALDAPLWSLNEEMEGDSLEREMKSGYAPGPKYLPLFEYLQASKKDKVTLSFDEISNLVGGLPKSAYVYSAWWVDGAHSHAAAWGNAGYSVDADQKSKVATFSR